MALSRSESNASIKPKTRRDLVLQEVGDEGLVYDREGALVHILNATALFTWKLCDGSRSVGVLTDSVCAAFAGATEDDVRRDLQGLVGQLAERGLLEVEG
ncbi:MAG: PqqD family protein [Acidobacteria bacterium]|nr:PqqD family protein [Acidobacteriota bacterium]